MDEMVKKTQTYLNATYGHDGRFKKIEENGKTGWDTIYALIRALQIELGVQDTANSFGPTTRNLLAGRFPNGIQQQSSTDLSEDKIYAIIQGALWCKGYSTGATGITRHFYGGTGNAIKKLKLDIGLSNSNATISVNLVAALLSMNQYVLLSRYGGTQEIRDIQQALNQTYESYIGLIPCDGLYGRDMNKAMIKVLQAVEGYSVAEATGNFGAGTKSKCPILPDTENLLTLDKRRKATQLLRYALCCNGYSSGSISNEWDSSLTNIVRDFQGEYALPINGKADVNTWMSLLLSKGNTDRNAIACDCSTILDKTKAEALYAANYRYVGRYLTGTVGGTRPKNLTREELNIIFAAGLRVFAIYQAGTPSLGYFTYLQGKGDALAAISAAKNLGIPFSNIIYFAVDFDIMDHQITSNVIPYFQGIREVIKDSGYLYKVGIYGPRNVCSRVSDKRLAVSSFVSDMSTGFSGNMGFKLPKNWAFDQFHEYNFPYSGGAFGLDKNAYSGRYSGFDNIAIHPEITVPEFDEGLLREQYIYLLSLLGITPSINFEWKSPETRIVGQTVFKFEASYKNAYTKSEGSNSVTVNITNGAMSNVEAENSQRIFDGLDQTTKGIISSDGTLSFMTMFESEIQNGTINYGYSYTPTSVTLRYVIEQLLWSDGDRESKLYVDISITVIKTTSTASQFEQLMEQTANGVNNLIVVSRSVLNWFAEEVAQAADDGNYGLVLLLILGAIVVVAPTPI